MIAVTVPAQITTVEDRIAGNLSLQQMILLAAPLFMGLLIFMLLPPNLHFVLYKLVIIGIIAFIFCTLSLRIKGQVLLFSLIILLRYTLRPRQYLFNKNDAYLREADSLPEPESEVADTAEVQKIQPLPQLSTADRVRLEPLAAQLTITLDKRGGAHAYVPESE